MVQLSHLQLFEAICRVCEMLLFTSLLSFISLGSVIL